MLEGSPRSGPPPLARRAFGRPPISLALVGLVTLLTAATGAPSGRWRDGRSTPGHARSWTTRWRRPRACADHAAEFLRHAESTVRLGPTLVARVLLAPDDFRALGDHALDRVVEAEPA